MSDSREPFRIRPRTAPTPWTKFIRQDVVPIFQDAVVGMSIILAIRAFEIVATFVLGPTSTIGGLITFIHGAGSALTYFIFAGVACLRIGERLVVRYRLLVHRSRKPVSELEEEDLA
jgi:hypothetical protein